MYCAKLGTIATHLRGGRARERRVGAAGARRAVQRAARAGGRTGAAAWPWGSRAAEGAAEAAPIGEREGMVEAAITCEQRGARELAFLLSKPCASTACWAASAGHLLRAAAAAGARHRRTARGGGRGHAQQQGQGCARAALGARCAACLRVAAPCAHVTKFGLSRDPGFFPLFQLEFTSMLSYPSPALPFSPHT